MNRSMLRGFTLQLALFAFVAVGIAYLDRLFSTSTRWAFLAVLAISLVPRGDLFRAFGARFSWILLVYLLWCLVTVMWSNVPLLSALKASAFLLAVVVFLGAGQAWAARHQPNNPLFFLLPVMACSVFAGLSGKAVRLAAGSGIEIYQGLAGNPNYLGILAASAIPLPLYQSFKSWNQQGNRLKALPWIVLMVLITWFLWRSGSRASMLCAFAIFAAFGLVVSRGRRLAAAILLIFLVGGISIVAPDLREGVYERAIVKSTSHGDAFVSRRMTWQRSFEAAQQGGAVGLGYGVSAGHNDFSLGLSAQLYGREKGNSQLAVWEETGLVGLALYVILLVAMFHELFRMLANTRNLDERVEIVLLTGLIVGLLLQSAFEAWWTSPGSAESAIFWSAIGVAMGMTQRQLVSTQARTVTPAYYPPPQPTVSSTV